MCDPTALLDLVPSKGLLKRPSMDYNEYTYCYGAGRGGWYSSLASSCVGFRVVFLRLETSPCGRPNVQDFPPVVRADFFAGLKSSLLRAGESPTEQGTIFMVDAYHEAA